MHSNHGYIHDQISSTSHEPETEQTSVVVMRSLLRRSRKLRRRTIPPRTDRGAEDERSPSGTTGFRSSATGIRLLS